MSEQLVEAASDAGAPPSAAAQPAGGLVLPRFELVAYNGGPLQVAEYTCPVVHDLAGLKVEQQIPVRLAHDRHRLLGHTSRVTIERERLTAEGVFSFVTADVREVVSAALHGFEWQVSIGVSAGRMQRVLLGEVVPVNGREIRGPAIVYRYGELTELSLVDVGADATTSVRVAAPGWTVELPPRVRPDSAHPTAAPEDPAMVYAIGDRSLLRDLRSMRSMGAQVVSLGWDQLCEATQRRILRTVQRELYGVAMPDQPEDPDDRLSAARAIARSLLEERVLTMPYTPELAAQLMHKADGRVDVEEYIGADLDGPGWCVRLVRHAESTL